MTVIELLYMLAAALALTACIPQLRQLMATKQSDEFSLQTWIVWTCAQMMALIYMISIGNVPLVLVNIAWTGFYAYMTYLIYRYRRTTVSSRELIDESV